MVLWMLFSMLVPAATVIWKRGQQRFCWMEQNFVQCYSIFKLHHANKINVIIIQASWSNRTNKWLNWNSHKKIEGIVTSPVSQGAENNQIVHHFCALYCIHEADSGVIKTSYRKTLTGVKLLKGRIYFLNWWVFHTVSGFSVPANNHHRVIGKKAMCSQKSGHPFSYMKNIFYHWMLFFLLFHDFLIYYCRAQHIAFLFRKTPTSRQSDHMTFFSDLNVYFREN